MLRTLILIGINGSLGKGATSVLLNKNYDKIYLCDRKPIDWIEESEKFIKITIDDVSNENNVISLFNKVEVDKDSQYYLYSTVGGFYADSVVDIDVKKLDQCFNINTKSAILLAKHFSRLVSQGIGGSICFTSAYTAEKASAGKSVYGSAKAALNYFIESLSLEGKENNLTANGIAPFALDSPENREWVKNTDHLVSPENIGEVVNDLFAAHPKRNGEIIKLPANIE